MTCFKKDQLTESYAFWKSSLINVPGIFLFFNHLKDSLAINTPSSICLFITKALCDSSIRGAITSLRREESILDMILYRAPTTLIGLYWSMDVGLSTFCINVTHVTFRCLGEQPVTKQSKTVQDGLINLLFYNIPHLPDCACFTSSLDGVFSRKIDCASVIFGWLSREKSNSGTGSWEKLCAKKLLISALRFSTPCMFLPLMCIWMISFFCFLNNVEA